MRFKERKSKWIVMPLALLMSFNVHATDTTGTCREVIEAAEKALAAKDTQIKIRDEQYGQAEILLQSQSKEITDLKASSDAWYNSHTLWFFIGVAAAGGSVYLLKQ